MNLWWRFWSWLRYWDWNETRIRVFENIYCNNNIYKQQLDKASRRIACFVCVTEDNVKEALNKSSSVPFIIFSQQESKQPHNYCVVRSSLQSLSTESLMPRSVTRRPSVKFKTLMVLPIGSVSGPSAPSRSFGFRISTSVIRLPVGHESSANWRNLQPSYVRNTFII
jgi:hypothetical protein